MGGFFAVASKENCVLDLFFGTDYHSHLGTRRAGMAVHGKDGFQTEPSTISRIPLSVPSLSRTRKTCGGNFGIGCISDFDPQPLIVHSHLGSFAITTRWQDQQCRRTDAGHAVQQRLQPFFGNERRKYQPDRDRGSPDQSERIHSWKASSYVQETVKRFS